MPDTALSKPSTDALAEHTFPRREALMLIVSTLIPAHTLQAESPQEKEINLKVGDTFPEIKLKNAAGEEVELAKAGKDRVVLVDFWGVWCGPCLREIPALNKTYRELRQKNFRRADDPAAVEKGFEVFSVAVQLDVSHHARWKEMVEKKTLEWKHNVESDSLEFVNAHYGVTSFPTNFLLDGTGKIIKKNVDILSISSMLTEVPVQSTKKD